MDMKRIAIVNVREGDWLMVPPGQGKHRGESEDSGILVVTDVWPGIVETYIQGYDMIDGWNYAICDKLFKDGGHVMVEVVR